MYLQPLQPINDGQIRVVGNVKIDPDAAIAPGVILQASADSQIIIAAGVCIGAGVIIHAHQGIINIGYAANLGVGVLIIGSGQIGANACIGAATTIFNASVEPMQVIRAGSLLGDTSRSVPLEIGAQEQEISQPEKANKVNPDTSESSTLNEEEPSEPESTTSEDIASPRNIAGQVHVQQILQTIFPYRQSLNNHHPPQQE